MSGLEEGKTSASDDLSQPIERRDFDGPKGS